VQAMEQEVVVDSGAALPRWAEGGTMACKHRAFDRSLSKLVEAFSNKNLQHPRQNNNGTKNEQQGPANIAIQ
jgi:hypothetical protein